jgi:site-specific recombinase XerD
MHGDSERPQRLLLSKPRLRVSERGTPFTTAGFARMIERAAVSADLELKAHPHMLRHACGYALSNFSTASSENSPAPNPPLSGAE